jgi:hypothetical protein
VSYEKIELHDANLKSTSVNYVAKTVALEIDYYPTEQANQRISATFKFSGVSDYAENSSIKELLTHSKVGGNISYWVPALKAGTTYFYLARGFISITAKSIAVVNHA